MNFTFKEKKNTLLLLFVGALISIIGYNFSFNVNLNGIKVAVAIPVSCYIGYGLWIYATSKIKNEYKSANGLFYISIIGIAFATLSLARMFIPTNTNIVYRLQEFATTTSQVTNYEELNELFAFFGEIKDYMILASVISLITTSLPSIIAMIYVIKTATELNNSWGGSYDNKLTIKHGKMAIGARIGLELFALCIIVVCFTFLGKVRFTEAGDINLADISSSLISTVILAFVIMIVAIVYLVYLIKLLIDLYRTYNMLKDETLYTTYGDDRQ